MNEYRFADLQIGMVETFEHLVTEEEMKSFLMITGDYNPLHTESAYALEHGFRERVVYGMLSASLISTLGGVYLPGKYCIIHQVETRFLSPVYEGDRLLVKGKIKELNESVQQVVIAVEMSNQHGEKVVKGKLFTGFLE